MWNKLPDDFKKAPSLNSFKHKFKAHFIKEYYRM